jgi:HEAT repeat protein
VAEPPLDPRAAVAVAGHRGETPTILAAAHHPDAAVRAVAVGALRRAGLLDGPRLEAALADPDPGVRRRACEEAAAASSPVGAVAHLIERLGDGDPSVVEAACFALGEAIPAATPPAASTGDGAPPAAATGNADTRSAVAALSQVAAGHDDPLCREAAVAALGAAGDSEGLAAILAATGDRPAVRRRAVLALAPFEGPAVDEALGRALQDRDWQVRQAAEDLTGPD